MTTFKERRNEFIRNIRAKMNSKTVHENTKSDIVLGNDIDADLVSLFEELFGPTDDNE